MFRQWFIWCLALVVLGGNVVACADQKSEKGTVKGKSELVAVEYGFTVLEDVEPSQFQIKYLELVPFLNPDDGGLINGTVLRQRALTLKANLGLVDAKRVLDNQTEIPPEFRGKYLVFAGTLYNGPINPDSMVRYKNYAKYHTSSAPHRP